MVNDIRVSVNREVIVDGPLEVSDSSYPFCSMKHCRVPYNLEEYGYTEEEYFISGFANVYEEGTKGQLSVKERELPYKTRVIVRRPQREEQFSGRVYLDILNATNGYDHEDLWTRIYQWCVENGHGYIGITSKPINVQALKTFDYRRYGTLNWSDGKKASLPSVLCHHSIPGTEEGLFWDMLSQTANRIKSGNSVNFFGGLQVKYLYLTGQSQSGAYLNTYVKYFSPYLTDREEKPLYDGYFNIVAIGLGRELCQSERPEPLFFSRIGELHPNAPYIALGSEGDILLFKEFERERDGWCDLDALQQDKYCRCYELAGSPHFDIKCPVIPSDGDILKSGRAPHKILPEEQRSDKINDLPLAYYVNGLLEKLHSWASDGEKPEVRPFIRRNENGELVRDIHGNVLGGLRSPFLDVPVASYHGYDEGKLGTTGRMRYFSREKFLSLYGTAENYLVWFAEYTQKQVEEKWITKEDAMRMNEWARRKAAEQYF